MDGQDGIANGRFNILLNLTRVRYVDSSGLGEMVAAQTAARRARGPDHPPWPPPKVRELFEMTRLSSVFDIYAEEPSARRNLSEG